jgi:hypothetical protein
VEVSRISTAAGGEEGTRPAAGGAAGGAEDVTAEDAEMEVEVAAEGEVEARAEGVPEVGWLSLPGVRLVARIVLWLSSMEWCFDQCIVT